MAPSGTVSNRGSETGPPAGNQGATRFYQSIRRVNWKDAYSADGSIGEVWKEPNKKGNWLGD